VWGVGDAQGSIADCLDVPFGIDMQSTATRMSLLTRMSFLTRISLDVHACVHVDMLEPMHKRSLALAKSPIPPFDLSRA
jgi:hypothetical protein